MVQRVPDEAELTELGRGLEQFLRRHVDDEHGRQDVVQETLLRVVLGIEGLRDRRALAGWARRIAFRIAMDRHRGTPPSASWSFEDARQDSLEPPADHLRDVEERRRDWLEGLLASLRELGVSDRGLVIGHYFVGFSVAELSRRTGLSRANVKVRLFRARARMREHLPGVEQYSSFLWARSRYDRSRAAPRNPLPRRA